MVFASAGGFVASLISALLLAKIGWRGMAMLGLVVTAAGAAVRLLALESVRWPSLSSGSRRAEGRCKSAPGRSRRA